MNWFRTHNHAINLDRVTEVVRHGDGRVVVYFGLNESVLYGDDAARLWDRLGGLYECGPTEADRAWADTTFRQVSPSDPIYTADRTPVEALREPVELVAAFWSSPA